MVVRIRFGKPTRVARVRRKNRRLALAVAAMLSPAAFLASMLGLWRLAADMQWAGSFAIVSGIFSHWQVWMGGAVLLGLCSRMLNRYGHGEDAAVS